MSGRRLCSLSPRLSIALKKRYQHTGSNDASSGSTHFGYQSVSEEEKAAKVVVREVFDNVATRYDLMNDCMSLGVHRLWKDYFVFRMQPKPNTKLVDVAGGTGDIAFRFLEHIKKTSGNKTSSSAEVTVCDINQPMLNVGAQKAKQRSTTDKITWVCGDAESLPFEDGSFDLYTIAFGIRNCTHIEKVLNEAYRVLTNGGRFFCLEFGHVNNALLGRLYDWYSFQVIPVLGQLVANDWHSYQYLVESIRQFPHQDEFAKMIRDAGFKCVSYENLSSGIVALHTGVKLT